jgi:hypothetical protein
MPVFVWARRSSIGYEISSKGDSRFSALFARLSDGRTIEEHYQCDVKGYDPGGRNWRLGKGRPPKGHWPDDTLYEAYRELWWQWSQDNPILCELLPELAAASGHVLTDMFATTPINQARAWADILNATA